MSEEKGLLPPFSGFPRLLAPSGKGRKRQKKGEKGRFRPISRKGGQTPLKPPFVTPLFAAAQYNAPSLHTVDSCRPSTGLSEILCEFLLCAFSAP